ncbi:uncharacterized protein LOC134852171 isoform X2 [Symsagittifera roscoffensis]|uniref:uncharacterized protein LOC134852171 isoform X2 n=1 Tax=Symsagittifera roscoffensis TaxID=84072 RepID=UPI00307B1718
MATLAFLERIRIEVLSQCFDVAQTQLEHFRSCIFEPVPPCFQLNCCIQFADDHDVARKCQIEVNQQMSFGHLKQDLKSKFTKLQDHRLTIVVGKRIPLDIITLEMLKVVRDGLTVYVLASDKNIHKSRMSVSRQYKVQKEIFIQNVDNQQALEMLEKIEGLISQKNIFDLVALIDAFKDRIEGGVLDEGPAALPPVLPRLIVHVEDIEQQRGTFVIPRVLWTSRICRLKSEIECRYSIPSQLQRWFLNNDIHDDQKRLCDVFADEDRMKSEMKVHLYLVTPETAGFTAAYIQQLYEQLTKQMTQKAAGNRDREETLSEDSDLDDSSEGEGEADTTASVNHPARQQVRFLDGQTDGEEYEYILDDHSTRTPLMARESHSVPMGLSSGAAVGGVRSRTAAVNGNITPIPMPRRLKPVAEAFTGPQDRVQVTWKCSVCSVATNRPFFKVCEVCGVGIQPEDFSIPDWYEADEDEMRKLAEERHNQLLTEQMLKNEKNIVNNEQLGDAAFRAQIPARKKKVGWVCEVCSFAESRPYFSFCEMCGQGKRPDDFIIPEGYEPDEDERAKIEWEKQNEQLTLQLLKTEEEREKALAGDRYIALQNAEMSEGCFPNVEPFECTVCYRDIDVGEGTALRQCHHLLCNECLVGHITASEDGVRVTCPFVEEDNSSCEQMIEQQEIRALLSEEQYDKLLQAGVSQAEAAEPNSFHCKTADCRGWCIVEENVNFFPCPLCGQQNCLTCAAIHSNMNCQQYQDDIKAKAANDEAARATEQMLQQLVQSGDAIHCPGCKVIVQKKSGCDWMQCSMCKMEICWATKGPRWGPGGKGDTSGGCKCRSPDRCTPTCGNCH